MRPSFMRHLSAITASEGVDTREYAIARDILNSEAIRGYRERVLDVVCLCNETKEVIRQRKPRISERLQFRFNGGATVLDKDLFKITYAK